MKLFQRIFFAAVLAGLAAGGVMAAIQQWKVAPLILEAEVYEQATHDHAGEAVTTAATHEHDETEWKPSDGPERVAYTVAADILAALGFALVLAAASTLTGLPITARNGVVWGLGGFIVFHLAPAFGLPPELPGMPAADLTARQLWWWGTALATGAALLGIAKYRNWTAIGVGAVLIVLPHIVGAPPAADTESSVPAHLATAFATSALSAAAVFWLIVGPLYGYLLERFATTTVSSTQRVPA